MPPDAGEPLPRVNLSMLRDPGRGCSWRLSLAHAGRSGNRGGDTRWAVRDRLTEAVRHAHAGGDDPRPGLTRVAADDLSEEEQAVLTTALRWYGELFADAVEILPSVAWERAFPSLGVRLVGAPPLVVRRRAGPRPVGMRILRLGRPPLPPPLSTDPEVRVALLLVDDPLPDRVELAVADLLHGRLERDEFDGPTTRREAQEWLAAGVGELHARLVDPGPRVGLECGWCPYVAACPAHRDRAEPAAPEPAAL